MVVNMLGTEAAFEILNVMEYSSARGRMSVIAKSPSGSVRLLSKGSDTKIINILQKGIPKALLDSTNSNLHLFATQVRMHAGIPDALTRFIVTLQRCPVRSVCGTCLEHVGDSPLPDADMCIAGVCERVLHLACKSHPAPSVMWVPWCTPACGERTEGALTAALGPCRGCARWPSARA